MNALEYEGTGRVEWTTIAREFSALVEPIGGCMRRLIVSLFFLAAFSTSGAMQAPQATAVTVVEGAVYDVVRVPPDRLASKKAV